MGNGSFKPGPDPRRNTAQTFRSGNEHRWQAGTSGNPAGMPRTRVEFEQAFNAALLTEGSPEEAAELLWKAARAGEAWAIQNLCQRFAPQTQSLRLVHEKGSDDGIDYTKLSDEQIRQLESILEGVQPIAVESGESPTEAV
jgi:hypothetical protein